jgi:hypothetical protein
MFVITGLVPVISLRDVQQYPPSRDGRDGRDGRDKPGHDSCYFASALSISGPSALAKFSAVIGPTSL